MAEQSAPASRSKFPSEPFDLSDSGLSAFLAGWGLAGTTPQSPSQPVLRALEAGSQGPPVVPSKSVIENGPEALGGDVDVVVDAGAVQADVARTTANGPSATLKRRKHQTEDVQYKLGGASSGMNDAFLFAGMVQARRPVTHLGLLQVVVGLLQVRLC
ncbi:MAG: hypothetical protein LC687_04275 [Actinobacteria bacterium]|nr:hypothetical protein [Actinomycetota bacterium]